MNILRKIPFLKNTSIKYQVFINTVSNVVLYGLTILISFAYSQTSFGLAIYTGEVFGSAGATYFGMLMSFMPSGLECLFFHLPCCLF